ncbi:CBS domain-containing protein CBSCBSPB3 [Canna indica]|nr:CBS domain-containing protein CBSCBSPB3 [Canna indica]
MSTHAAPLPRRSNLVPRRPPTAVKKPVPSDNGGTAANGNDSKPTSPSHASGERTVKKLRLSKALTIPEGTTVSDACRRMAARRVDSVLLTDANGLLSGIVTDKDIATRVLAEGLRPEQTFVSKIMTRNPLFVMADTPASEALQKMVQGKFRHLPVVENGEVIAMLDITKCLYDAISRMEKAAEHGSAIAAAVEGVENQWGNKYTAPYAFIETLRERMFKPTLSSIVTELSKVAVVSSSDPVHVAAKRMREFRVNSVIIMAGNKPHGILTSKDLLMRVVAQNLSPELTLVEKVMTLDPECATLDTTILDALHIMHDGKFLHLPVLDRDGSIVACLDVLQLTHAAISMVEGGAVVVNDMANTMLHKFWDSALALEATDEEFDRHSSDFSVFMASESAETGKSMCPPHIGNSFSFKFEDRRGRVHRLNCGTETLDELVSAVMQRIGLDCDGDKPQLLYEDDEGDKVLLTSDNDVVGAVNQARSAGWKVLRLHIDYLETNKETTGSSPSDLAEVQSSRVTSLQLGILAGTVALAGIGIMIYLKRSNIQLNIIFKVNIIINWALDNVRKKGLKDVTVVSDCLRAIRVLRAEDGGNLRRDRFGGMPILANSSYLPGASIWQNEEANVVSVSGVGISDGFQYGVFSDERRMVFQDEVLLKNSGMLSVIDEFVADKCNIASRLLSGLVAAASALRWHLKDEKSQQPGNLAIKLLYQGGQTYIVAVDGGDGRLRCYLKDISNLAHITTFFTNLMAKLVIIVEGGSSDQLLFLSREGREQLQKQEAERPVEIKFQGFLLSTSREDFFCLFDGMSTFSGDETAPFFGFLGAAAALVFSCMGAAYGTAKSGVGVASMGVMRPELVMKSIVPVVMAGVLGIYGLIIAVIISTGINPKAKSYYLFDGYAHLSSGLACGLAGLSAGMAIGIVGDAGVRANAQQPKLFVGMILILIFAEALALYGLIVGIILSSRAGQSRAD